MVETRKRLDILRAQLVEAWMSHHHDFDLIGKINAELRSLIGLMPPPPEEEETMLTPAQKKPYDELDADSIMIAIEEAAKHVKCHPEEILCGLPPEGGTKEYITRVARGRAHAALALQALFNAPAAQISRACGSSEASCGVHLSTLHKRIAEGQCDWLQQEAIDAIKNEIVKIKEKQ